MYNKNENNEKDHRSTNERVSQSNGRKKIRGAKTLHKRLIGLLLALALALSGAATTDKIKEKIYTNAYSNAMDLGIDPKFYLSDQGDPNNWLYSPLFGSDTKKTSSIFSQDNEFDNDLLETYAKYGNNGLNDKISETLAEGKMLGINDMQKLAKAVKVFAFSVLQEEFINSLDKKNSSVKYVNTVKDKNDDYNISLFDQNGNTVGTYKVDKNISNYIKNLYGYNEKINSSFNKIAANYNNNPNYNTSVDCNDKLSEIYHDAEKELEEANKFAYLIHYENHFDKYGTKVPNLNKGTGGFDITDKNGYDGHDDER